MSELLNYTADNHIIFIESEKTYKEWSIDKPMPYRLSEREIEIIRLVVDGMTSTEIGEKLFISEHTVKTHRKNILRKTGINGTGQLALFAINNGLMDFVGSPSL